MNYIFAGACCFAAASKGIDLVNRISPQNEGACNRLQSGSGMVQKAQVAALDLLGKESFFYLKILTDASPILVLTAEILMKQYLLGFRNSTLISQAALSTCLVASGLLFKVVADDSEQAISYLLLHNSKEGAILRDMMRPQTNEEVALMENDNFLKENICPISLLPIRHPVQDHEGNIYELREIVRWLCSKQTSPVSRSPLKIQQLKFMPGLQRKIDDRLEDLRKQTV